MSLLTDGQIIDSLKSGDLVIEPCSRSQIQPASVDLHLGNEFRWYRRYPVSYQGCATGAAPLDPLEVLDVDENMEHLTIGLDKEFILKPGHFILASTKELIRLSTSLAARIEGKSTLARYGIIVHSTAGFVDPGFQGSLTLEMTNFNPRPVVLHPGMRIAQLSILRLQWSVLNPYGTEILNNHYQNQRGAVPPAPLTVHRI